MTNIFKVDVIENSGDNWLIADFGVDSQDNKHYILTTDNVPASKLCQYTNGARADAERICRLLNLVIHDSNVASKPLWSDERIMEAVAVESVHHSASGLRILPSDYAEGLLRKMRNDYESTLTELRAKVADLHDRNVELERANRRLIERLAIADDTIEVLSEE